MRNFLIRRLFQTVLLVVIISALIFFILNLVPGGPFDALRFANPRISQERIRQLEEMLGLTKPLHQRYLDWLVRMLQGDWGTSWGVAYGEPVLRVIQSRLANTLLLMGLSTLASIVIALPVGIYSAIRQYSRLDYLVTAFSFFGTSMPTFWFGLMLIFFFAVQLRWFPAGGVATPGMEGNILDRLHHLVLPVTVLSLFNVSGWSRYVRSSMLDVLGQDYLRTARAKGLRERVVIAKHALRNALIPVITLVGLDLPGLFSGAIITETIFAWPGMGILFWQGINATDWPLVQGILVITASLVVLSNLLADILYAVADPRIRYE